MKLNNEYIENVQTARHRLHCLCPESIYHSEMSDYDIRVDVLSDVVNILKKLPATGHRKKLEDILEALICGYAVEESEDDEIFSGCVELHEEINDIIENYLGYIEKKYNQEGLVPTGEARRRYYDRAIALIN